MQGIDALSMDRIRERICACALIVVVLAVPGKALAVRAAWLIPPVDGAISRGFEAPTSSYGPGHRGIDFAVAPGTRVRAAGSGSVTFAGPVAGILAVTISHGGGIETTYSDLSQVLVKRGQLVDQGTFIGVVGSSHPGAGGGLHFGVKVDGQYVDPASFLGPTDVRDAIHLAPLAQQPRTSAAGEALTHQGVGTAETPCRALQPLEDKPPRPNDDVAVAIAGIGSKTKNGVNADMYTYGPELLGYPHSMVYRFSYKGSRGPHLHEPYVKTDTFESIEGAAARLRTLLRRIEKRHPGVDVDLVAHSQGGVVAREYLEELAKPWNPSLPRIDHVVTFATPHQGAPLAADVPILVRDRGARAVLDGLSFWARRGGPLPDPFSPAVTELASGSPLMRRLATQDVVYGTRVLALAMPTDLAVPADHALWPGNAGRVVPPQGLWSHVGILQSKDARAIAYNFLRDAPNSCPGMWDAWGPRMGAGISWVESHVPPLWRAAETLVAAKALKGVNAFRSMGARLARLARLPPP
jgi:hypothetical protein